jgi:hypothetical protein
VTLPSEHPHRHHATVARELRQVLEFEDVRDPEQHRQLGCLQLAGLDRLKPPWILTDPVGKDGAGHAALFAVPLDALADGQRWIWRRHGCTSSRAPGA